MSSTIKKILIANRGEIAVRIIRTCKEMDIKSVAVYSEVDKTAHHVRLADESFLIGPAPSSESYLNQKKIIEVAKACKAEAIHPGYGFLAENAQFAQKCIDNKIIFIGPTPETISLLGDKLRARHTATDASLPIVPGLEIENKDIDFISKASEEIGYPVLIKAIAGGGGKGMRVVHAADELKEAISRASSEAKTAFGDERIYLEKYIEKPRHIEIQILADSYGNVVHLGERECSIQRRHQKLIEESPSPFVDDVLRSKMTEAAIKIAKRANYTGAGTVEFIVNQNGEFYFLEVNTRLQVEHPVTELVTGLDLVKEQINIARGEKLPFQQSDLKFNGHAIEFRICAEDPENNFMPSTGRLKNYRPPSGPGVRIDSGVLIFSEVPVYYDSLIAKLIIWGKTRDEAIARSKRALEEFRISGVSTTIRFHRSVIENDKFVSGDLSTDFLASQYPDNNFSPITIALAEKAAVAMAINFYLNSQKTKIPEKNRSLLKDRSWQMAYRTKNLNQTKEG